MYIHLQTDRQADICFICKCTFINENYLCNHVFILRRYI